MPRTNVTSKHTSPRSAGRPPKLDATGRPTRERLLDAAADACVEHGFEGATVADIARRAEVSTPAIYNHFSGKSDLLVEACRWALSRLPLDNDSPQPAEVVRVYLSPGFAAARTLQLELHLAAQRHPDVRDLLARWHSENAAYWANANIPVVQVKAWYLFLLGVAQVDALTSLETSAEDLEAQLQRMAVDLFKH